MSTTDKLTTTAENVPKVYYAGQMNVVKSSTYLNGFKYGRGEVTVNDISPIEHVLKVAVVTGSDVLLYELEDTPMYNNDRIAFPYAVTLEAENVYRFSINAAFGGNALIALFKQDGGHLKNFYLTNGYNQFYYTPPKNVGRVAITLSENTEGRIFKFTDFCIYKVKPATGLGGISINELDSSGKTLGTYQSSADGMVYGIKSTYPVTRLKADAEDVLINCNYHKDIDKTINNLQTNIALSGGE